jgi:hypothetical protein
VDRTEELLAATALFNNLDETWLQLFNRWHVVCQYTHIASLCGKIYLNTASCQSCDDRIEVELHIGALVDGLSTQSQLFSSISQLIDIDLSRLNESYLMGESQGQLDLVGSNIGIASSLDRGPEEGRAHSECRASNPSGAHCRLRYGRGSIEERRRF